MKYQVKGVDKTSGREVITTLEALSRAAAEERANSLGVMVETVEPPADQPPPEQWVIRGRPVMAAFIVTIGSIGAIATAAGGSNVGNDGMVGVGILGFTVSLALAGLLDDKYVRVVKPRRK